MRSFLWLIAVVFFAASAEAGETLWQEVAPGVHLRLISTGKLAPDGSSLLALEFDMPDNTKTYWRVPGETGFPAEIDLSASTGIGEHLIRWPYPQRKEAGGYLDYAYFGDTVLPLQVEVSDPGGTIDLQATLGVCSEICVPARARFVLPVLDAAPDMPNGLRIRQALAEVPLNWDSAGDPLGRVELLASGDAVSVEISDGQIVPESLIVATAEGAPLFGTPQKSPQANLVVLPILGKTDNIALEGVDVEVTFMTDMGAYVVNRTIEAGEVANAALPQ